MINIYMAININHPKNVIESLTGSLKLNSAKVIFNNDGEIAHDFTVHGNQQIDGNLNVDGNINLKGNITIGNQAVDTITVAADFTSDLIPVDNSYSLGSPTNKWKMLFAGGITADSINVPNIIDSSLTQGRVTFAGLNSKLTDDNNLTFNPITGTLTTNSLSVTNNSVLLGTLEVDHNTTLHSNLTVEGNTDVKSLSATTGSYSDTLEVGGATKLDTTLTVQGAVTLQSTLNVNGVTNVGVINSSTAANLTNATVSNDLTVLGDTTLHGNLTVQGTVTSINTTNTEIKDAIIKLNDGETGSGVSTNYSGLNVDRGLLNSATFYWNENLKRWEIKEGDNLSNFAAAAVQAGNISIAGNTITATDPSGNVNINSGPTGQVNINGKKVGTDTDALVYAIVFGG